MVRALPLALLVAAVASTPLWGVSDSKALPEMDVRFLDGSTARVSVVEESLELETRYGKLAVPCGELRKVEFALRLEQGIEKRIEEAIGQLGSKEFHQREAAGKELLQLAIPAYPSLKKNVSSKDPEVARRCEALVKQIEGAVPINRLQMRANDLVQTREFTVTGRLTAAKLKVRNKYFGEAELPVYELHSMHLTSAGFQGVTAAFANEPGVLRIAHLFERGEFFEARESAETFGKGKQVEDLARLFRQRPKGGVGIGLKAGVIKPDGIEAMFMSLENSPIEPVRANLDANADDMARACYVAAAIAEAHRSHCPVKAKTGKKDPKDWDTWSTAVRDSSIELAGAVQEKQIVKVRAVVKKINNACSSCHDIFRECN